MTKNKNKRKLSTRQVARSNKIGRKLSKNHARASSENNGNGSTKKAAVYVLNTEFGSFNELRDLILKSLPAEQDDMIERLNKLGKIKLAVISGIFINKEHLDPLIVDLLIVGDYIEGRKLRLFLKSLEAEVGKEVKYSVMDREEFQYRLAMFDRFVRVILESPHEKLINKLGI